jgi:hypothetical protein
MKHFVQRSMKTDDYKQRIETTNAINAALASDRPAVEEIK